MSIYATATLGEADNLLTFNDVTKDPYFRTVARAASKWQIRQQDLPVPFESGSSDFLTLLGDSAFIINGKMYPSSEITYDAGLVALRSVASLDIEQADPSSDEGYVPYITGDGSGDMDKQIFMKPLYCQIAETTTQGFIQPFTIYCKVKDPTIYSASAKVASTQASSVSTSTGAAVYPFTYPVVFGATLLAVSATATNNGTLASYPASITVHGPVNTPKVTNQATGEFITVNVNMNSTNDVLSIIYDKDTLNVTLNGVNTIQNITSDSTLFKIHPGANVISLTGSSISDDAYATVNYYDSWPLA